jgi:hypothetical protein
MQASAQRRPNGSQSDHRGTVKRRLSWEDVVPFPSNPIYQGRLASMQREWGGYNHAIVGAPAIFDNSKNAFPDFPTDALFIGDGNHRHELAKIDGKTHEEFIADLYRGLSRAEMFKLRRGLNDRRTVKPSERFLALVEEGDVTCRAILKAVEGAGWRITYESVDGGLPFVNELQWIWRHDRTALVRALDAYREAFGQSPAKGQGAVIKGLGAFWVKYPQADMNRLVKSLKAVKPKRHMRTGESAVAELYVSGRASADLTFINSTFDGIRYVIAQGYNRYQRGGKKLPVAE